MIRRYKGYTIEVASDGEYAQVRLWGAFQVDFRGPNSYDDAKRWVDEHRAAVRREE